jgi:hypothetical protein
MCNDCPYCRHMFERKTRKLGDSRSSWLRQRIVHSLFGHADIVVPLAEQRAKRAIMCVVALDYLSKIPEERAISWHDRLGTKTYARRGEPPSREERCLEVLVDGVQDDSS